MDRYESLKAALAVTLGDLKVTIGEPVNLLKVGPPLVAQGYTQDEIVNTLFALESQKAIDLIEGNRLS